MKIELPARRARVAAAVLFGAMAASACAARMSPMAGVAAPASARLPAADLAPGHRTLVFQWELRDRDRTARGEGAARIAGPDSVRLDFFLAGAHAAGAAILIGESLRTPQSGADLIERVVPPPPLLWAALGHVALPPLADTTILLDGDVTRVALGRPVTWRMVFRRDLLVRMERVEGRRVVEWVQRDAAGGGNVRYRHERERRSLNLTITGREEGMEFDAAIWRLPH